MAENICNVEEEQKFRQVAYEQIWTLPEMTGDFQRQTWMQNQSFKFETGRPSEAQTKWSIGFTRHELSGNYRMYWKLIEVKGFPEKGVLANINCTILKGDVLGGAWAYNQRCLVELGQTIESPETVNLDIEFFEPTKKSYYIQEIAFQIKLKIMEPKTKLPYVDLKMKRFHKTCSAQMQANFAGLIGDAATADLKIITSDGKEILAHNAILKARFPKFDTMFCSDLAENKTGVLRVNVKDVSFKTMGIFLHLFYSGKLLPSWKDQDTVVEFTKAVGKYQLSNVLKLLDEVLGSRDEEDATYVDMQLLDLAYKMDLKNAEKELVERIKRTMSKISSRAEVFALYGVKGDA